MNLVDALIDSYDAQLFQLGDPQNPIEEDMYKTKAKCETRHENEHGFISKIILFVFI